MIGEEYTKGLMKRIEAEKNEEPKCLICKEDATTIMTSNPKKISFGLCEVCYEDLKKSFVFLHRSRLG